MLIIFRELLSIFMSLITVCDLLCIRPDYIYALLQQSCISFVSDYVPGRLWSTSHLTLDQMTLVQMPLSTYITEVVLCQHVQAMEAQRIEDGNCWIE